MLIYKKKHLSVLLSRNIKIKKISLFTIFFLSLIFFFLSSVYLGANLYKNGTISEIKRTIYASPNKIKSQLYSYLNKDPKLYIDIGLKEFKRLEYTRKRNLINKFGSYNSNDWVAAKINYNEEKHNIKIRLKGVFYDHWNDPFKWSFRMKIKNGKTFLGSNELSLQDPSTRDYLYEWVFMKMLSDSNLIHHRTKFTEVVVNGESYGLYMISDQYSKYLIEFNKRREGPIIGFNKDLTVSAYQKGNDNTFLWNEADDDIYKAPLSVLRTTVKNDPNLINLANKGLQILQSFREGRINTHEAFDYKALAKVTAIRTLLGSGEFDWKDIKFYVNPISLKLEPIIKEVHANEILDLNSWNKWNMSTGHDMDQFQKLVFSDPIFFEEYNKQLFAVSRISFLEKFYEKHSKKLYELEAKINNFEKYKFPYNKIENNAKLLRAAMDPPEAINSYITIINDKNVLLKISSIQPLASEVRCITYQNNPILCPDNKILVYGKPNKSPPKYQSVSMKWMVNNFNINENINDIYLNYNILGSRNIKKTQIRKGDIENINLHKELPLNYNNINNFDWIKVNHEKKIIKIAGEQIVNNNIVFPKEYKVYILTGTKLKLLNNANLFFQGPIFIEGEKNNPVIIQCTKEKGSGLLVLNSKERSKLKNVLFYGMSAPKYRDLNLSGAITFYESDVDISNVIFNNNYRGDDYLNIIRSNFTINDSFFKKTLYDAVDLDFSDGLISNTVFEEIGNDALDFSGSSVILDNIIANNVSDKAISAGEESYITISNTLIKNSKFGIVSKDKSNILANNTEFSNIAYIAAAYQKKSEFGAAKLTLNNYKVNDGDSEFIVGNNSQINLDGNKILNNINTELINDILNF